MSDEAVVECVRYVATMLGFVGITWAGAWSLVRLYQICETTDEGKR